MNLQRPAEGAKLLEIAHRRDRTDPVKAQLLVKALVAAGRFDRAEKVLAEITAHPTLRKDLPELKHKIMQIMNEEGGS